MELRIRHGGLMRCCLATFHEAATRGDLPTEPGSTLDCTYEDPGNKNMILAADGVWQWNHGEVK